MPTYPLLLLAITLHRQDSKSISKRLSHLALFTLSFIVAILLTYTINWFVHGVFWVPLAEWREATPAHNLLEMQAHLPKLIETFNVFLTKSSFDFFPAQVYHLGLMTAATAVLLRYAPLNAFYIYAGYSTDFHTSSQVKGLHSRKNTHFRLDFLRHRNCKNCRSCWFKAPVCRPNGT